jgi:hypothetical protein
VKVVLCVHLWKIYSSFLAVVFWYFDYFQNIYKVSLKCLVGMVTAVYIISYQFATRLEMLTLNVIFYGVTINIYSLHCISHTTKHYFQTHVWYTLNKTCLFSFQ